MKPVRFVHCADLHIDTPFKGISEIQPELQQSLYQAPFQSFNNIVNLAIEEKVDCVVIAGDIYDSEDKSLSAQLKFRDGLVRLSKAGIQAFIVYGNHDPLDSWSATLEWPAEVHRFPGEEVECVPLLREGEIIAKIYGISFAKRDVRENLALKFPKADNDVPCIGLLHANVGANIAHKPYSPCTIEDLSSIGMDYWALGHVHIHEVLRPANPAIVYPGCSQSRHARETGQKGCCLVTLGADTKPAIEFIPTDTIRYTSDSVDISNCQDIGDVVDFIKDRCQAISSQSEGRNSIIRLTLTGRTDLYKDLQKGSSIPAIAEDVREQLSGSNPWIWLEKLELATAGNYDIDQLRQGNNLVADIISIFDELEGAKSQDLEELRETLKPLFIEWRGSSYLGELTDDELLELATEARNQLLDKSVTD